MERFVPKLVGGFDGESECPACGVIVRYVLADGEKCDACRVAAERIAERVALVDAMTPTRFRGFQVEVPRIRDWVQRVVDGEKPEGLAIVGLPGPGKSGNAYAALRLVAELGYRKSIHRQKVVALVQNVDLPEQRARVKVLETAGLLLLDDLGAHVVREWGEGVILQVIDTRWEEQRPTIITSNLTRSSLTDPEWAKTEGLGERIASRLASYEWVQMGNADPLASDRRRAR